MGIKTVVIGIEAFRHLWTPKIQCDTCGTQFIAHGLHGWDSLRDPAKVERVIRENGWDIIDGRHICPDHVGFFGMEDSIQRVRLALLAEMQRQHSDPATTSPFVLSDGCGNNTLLDFTGLARAALNAML